MKNMLRDAAVLLVITLFAGLVLGFVYQITKQPIAMAEEKAAKEAYAEVFPTASDFELMELAVSDNGAWIEEWKNAGFGNVEIINLPQPFRELFTIKQDPALNDGEIVLDLSGEELIAYTNKRNCQ